VTNFALPDGNTSPYGMQLADELSKELASQNHKIQVIDRRLLQNLLAKDLVPAKSVNAGLVRSIAFTLKARFVVLGTTKRTDDDVVQLSTRLFDVADKNAGGYSALMLPMASPKTTVLYTAVLSVHQSNEVMPTIYFCHAINKGPGMLRAVLSSEETASLLKLRSAHYVGLLFPTATENRKADFGVLRVSEVEGHGEWRVGFYCFDTDIMALEEAIQTCTAKLPAVGTKQAEN
jgi:hypothetical protein